MPVSDMTYVASMFMIDLPQLLNIEMKGKFEIYLPFNEGISGVNFKIFELPLKFSNELNMVHRIFDIENKFLAENSRFK